MACARYFYRLIPVACPQQRDQQLIKCEAIFLITAFTALRICHRKLPKSAWGVILHGLGKTPVTFFNSFTQV